jgi:hypothetical protein
MFNTLNFRLGLLQAILALIGTANLYPCQCARTTNCPSLPDGEDKRVTEAVFLGTVTDVSGISFESIMRKKGWITPEPIRISEAEWNSAMEFYRNALLTAWTGYLSDQELDQIRNARQAIDVPRIASDHLRVRLRVIENFGTAGEADFEVLTGFGGADCGPEFEVGKTYLVFAGTARGSSRWFTDSCAGTHEINDGDQDLRTLRDLKSDQEFRLRIYGHLYLSQLPDVPRVRNATITLSRDSILMKETRTDQDGNFIFEGLEPGQYRVEAQVPGFSTTPRSDGQEMIDLTTASCARLLLSVQKDLSPTDR